MWEIGEEGIDVRDLRARLRLDSGYASRLLRSLEAQQCLEGYFTELAQRFDDGFEAARSLPADAPDLRPPEGVLLVATLRSNPIGCGAVKFHGAGPAEIKRMWVDASARGLGLGRRLLRELEALARDHGSPALRLETNRALVEAITLYRSSGYQEVPAVNDETYAHHWFEKTLRPAADQPSDGPRT